jgi:hypothetical protein
MFHILWEEVGAKEKKTSEEDTSTLGYLIYQPSKATMKTIPKTKAKDSDDFQTV